MEFLRNFDAANKKRNMKRFGLMALGQDLSFIDDMPPDNLQQNNLVFTSTPQFDAASGDILSMTLTGNITMSTLVFTGPAAPVPPGTQVYLRFQQDSVGGRTVVFPSNLVLESGLNVDPLPNRVTLFPIIFNGTTNLWECFCPPFSFPGE